MPGAESRNDSPIANPSRGKRPQLLLAAHWILWGLCFAGASILIRHHLISGSIAWLVAAIPSIAAVWLFVAYTRYLRQADELERLIELQALGWGFGGGFFAICGYWVFELLGAPAVDTATFTSILPVLYVIAKCAVWWRYR
jgi:hypothetical protein